MWSHGEVRCPLWEATQALCSSVPLWLIASLSAIHVFISIRNLSANPANWQTGGMEWKLEMPSSAVGGGIKTTREVIHQANKQYEETWQRDAGGGSIIVGGRNCLQRDFPALAWLDWEDSQSSSGSRGAADVPTCIVMSGINLSRSPCSTELSLEERVKVYCSLLPPHGVTDHIAVVKSYLKSIHQYRM